MWLAWLPDKPQGSSCLCLAGVTLDVPGPAFYDSVGNLSSGPHIYTARTLLTLPLPHPLQP